MDRMISGALPRALGALLVAIAVLVLAAPEAAAHSGPHPGGAAVAGQEGGEPPSAGAVPCCHAGGACFAPLCFDPVGALSHLSWTRAALRLTGGAPPSSLAGGADPPPPRG